MTPQQPCEFIHLAAQSQTEAYSRSDERYLHVSKLFDVGVNAERTSVYVLACEEWFHGEQAASLLRYLEQHSGNW
jgi:hypothetical protein